MIYLRKNCISPAQLTYLAPFVLLLFKDSSVGIDVIEEIDRYIMNIYMIISQGENNFESHLLFGVTEDTKSLKESNK